MDEKTASMVGRCVFQCSGRSEILIGLLVYFSHSLEVHSDPRSRVGLHQMAGSQENRV